MNPNSTDPKPFQAPRHGKPYTPETPQPAIPPTVIQKPADGRVTPPVVATPVPPAPARTSTSHKGDAEPKHTDKNSAQYDQTDVNR